MDNILKYYTYFAAAALPGFVYGYVILYLANRRLIRFLDRLGKRD